MITRVVLKDQYHQPLCPIVSRTMAMNSILGQHFMLGIIRSEPLPLSLKISISCLTILDKTTGLWAE